MSTSLQTPEEVYVSEPLDITSQWDSTSVKNKTYLITGGCSGFGKGFFIELAKLGACVIIGDLSDGTKLVEEVKKDTGNVKLHYLPLDVTSYISQSTFFLTAIQLSPKKAIDGVIANAGITEKDEFVAPQPYIPFTAPPPPNLKTIEVNLTGVMYTTYLTYHFLRNHPHLSSHSYPNKDHDRTLLLIGSCSSFTSLPPVASYSTSKHGVLGMFRALRFTSNAPKIRINMLAPYFVETGILPGGGMLLLAGAQLTGIQEVVDAGVRCMGDTSVAGRCLAIWPKSADEGGTVDYPIDDFREVEVFTRRVVKAMNVQISIEGWLGWGKDVLGAVWGMLIGRTAAR